MYFNRKNAEQKNWRMTKKRKCFLFSCSLVFAVGAALVAPSVKADTVETKPEATLEAFTRSRRALSPANGTTRSFDSELQNEAQKKAIFSPGVKGEKQTYQGTVWLYRNGTVNNDNQKDAKRLGGVNVYLQYVTGKGFFVTSL